MGIYLSSPKTEKSSEDGENEKLRYGVSSMQGWRASMEDAVSVATLFPHILFFSSGILCACFNSLSLYLLPCFLCVLWCVPIFVYVVLFF